MDLTDEETFNDILRRYRESICMSTEEICRRYRIPHTELTEIGLKMTDLVFYIIPKDELLKCPDESFVVKKNTIEEYIKNAKPL
jgi:hypothetical protein